MHFSTWRSDLTIRPSSSNQITMLMLIQQQLPLLQNAWVVLLMPGIG